jgi:peptide chain release factor subunit 1
MAPFNYQIKILGVVDTGYTDEYGVREVLAKSSEILAEQSAIKERQIVERFIKEIVSDGLATYGEKEVRNAIETKKASTVLLSEELNYQRVKLLGPDGKEYFFTIKNKEELEEKIKQGYTLISETNLLDDLIELCEKMGVEVVLVSKNTAEGAQFLGSFYGIGAFLRYK